MMMTRLSLLFFLIQVLVQPNLDRWRVTAAAAPTTPEATTATGGSCLSGTLFVTPQFWLPPTISLSDSDMKYQNVTACFRTDNQETKDATTCEASTTATTTTTTTTTVEPLILGRMPQFTTAQAYAVLQEAQAAWNGGAGVWTQMTLPERCAALRTFLQLLQQPSTRQAMVTTLLHEIGKNRRDAEQEVDRTIQFAEQVLHVVETDPDFTGTWQTIGTTTRAMVRRAARGIVMAVAPYNYPLNECYATIIPALLVGNIVVVKLPTVGGLVHLLTLPAWEQALPPGTIHFIAGSGRSTLPPLMETGAIDALAFIGGSYKRERERESQCVMCVCAYGWMVVFVGRLLVVFRVCVCQSFHVGILSFFFSWHTIIGSKAADQLISSHPHPHRLKVFLQLEANNMAIYLKDLFDDTPTAKTLFEHALKEAMIGSLSFNGQRCTALKLHFVPKDHADTFVPALVERVQALTVGLPDQRHGDKQEYSQITPLPNQGRIQYMQELIQDAVRKGARIVNERGGTIVGGPHSTLMVPAVLYPVTPHMRVYHEEQFGPIVPITTYDDLDTVLKFGQDGMYAQQVSIFGQDSASTAVLIDRFHAVFGKINLNSQCGRSPDTLPFSGRRSSALGVMSVRDALHEFSVPTVVAMPQTVPHHQDFVSHLQQASRFLQPVV